LWTNFHEILWVDGVWSRDESLSIADAASAARQKKPIADKDCMYLRLLTYEIGALQMHDDDKI